MRTLLQPQVHPTAPSFLRALDLGSSESLTRQYLGECVRLIAHFGLLRSAAGPRNPVLARALSSGRRVSCGSEGAPRERPGPRKLQWRLTVTRGTQPACSDTDLAQGESMPDAARAR